MSSQISWFAVPIALIAFMSAACTPPTFIAPKSRRLAASTSGTDDTEGRAILNSGYLRLIVTSNLDALNGNDFANIAKGYKFLAVNAVLNTGTSSNATEVPLLLYDLSSKRRREISQLAVGNANYVNVNSATQATLKLQVRAIPRTLAAAYRDVFNSVSEVMKSAPLVRDALAAKPYAVMAGQLFKRFGERAAAGDENSQQDVELGLTTPQGFAQTTNYTDGQPFVVFLVRTDGEGPSAPHDLKKFTLCSGRDALCVRAKSPSRPYKELPYLIIRAAITEYRPTRDLIGRKSSWCEHARQGTANIDKLVERYAQLTLTSRQDEMERGLIDRAKVVAMAHELPDGDIGADSAYRNQVANLIQRWVVIHEPTQKKEIWGRYYANSWNALHVCFKRALDGKSPEHQLVRKLFAHALDARKKLVNLVSSTSLSAPLPTEHRDDIFEMLSHINAPLWFYPSTHGKLFRELLSARAIAEDALYPSAAKDAENLEAAASGERREARLKAAAWLSQGCERCNVRINRAIARVTNSTSPAHANEDRAEIVEHADNLASLVQIVATTAKTGPEAAQAQTEQTQISMEAKELLQQLPLKLAGTRGSSAADTREYLEQLNSTEKTLRKQLNETLAE